MAQREPDATTRSWPLLSLFSLAYAFFITAPSIFHGDFPLRADMEWGDVIDIATPLVVWGLLWLIVRQAVGTPSAPWTLTFLILALVWAQGQGMHLAANSIGHQVPGGHQDALSDLVHFYDEQLSHYIWYAAVAALPMYLLTLSASHKGLASGKPVVAVAPAALLFGAVIGFSSIEAAVVPMMLPTLIAAALTAGHFWYHQPRLRQVELFAFIGASILVALGVLLGWGAYHGGWPEPSELGII